MVRVLRRLRRLEAGIQKKTNYAAEVRSELRFGYGSEQEPELAVEFWMLSAGGRTKCSLSARQRARQRSG